MDEEDPTLVTDGGVSDTEELRDMFLDRLNETDAWKNLDELIYQTKNVDLDALDHSDDVERHLVEATEHLVHARDLVQAEVSDELLQELLDEGGESA